MLPAASFRVAAEVPANRQRDADQPTGYLPLYRCESLGSRLGCAVSIKLETANPLRSFKAVHCHA
jgi:threonine dehydratase